MKSKNLIDESIKLQLDAKALGLDWIELDKIISKIREETDELEEAMNVVDKFGTDARSISRTLENIKDPEQVEKAVQTENVEKFVERNKQLKNLFLFSLNTDYKKLHAME